ncbi:MAG: nitroreductase family protein [Candidatus Heimdallarchaeaceae archaeon]
MSEQVSEIVYNLIKERRCIRGFTEQEVPESLVKKILEAGWMAPSAGNRQPVEFVIIKNKSTLQKISSQKFVSEASVAIVVVANKERVTSRYGERGKRMYIYHDSAAAIQNILLMVKALGLGACWVGAFNDEKVSKFLELPENVLPMAIIPIGYPKREPEPPRKIPLEKITHEEKYEEKKIKEYLMSLIE